MAQEQRRAQLLFQLLNPRGHVGLHAAQLFCRAGHAAFGRHGFEDFECGEPSKRSF